MTRQEFKICKFCGKNILLSLKHYIVQEAVE